MNCLFLLCIFIFRCIGFCSNVLCLSFLKYLFTNVFISSPTQTIPVFIYYRFGVKKDEIQTNQVISCHPPKSKYPQQHRRMVLLPYSRGCDINWNSTSLHKIYNVIPIYVICSLSNSIRICPHRGQCNTCAPRVLLQTFQR